MTERRYIVGSPTRLQYAIESTKRAPAPTNSDHRSGQAYFPTKDGDKGFGRLHIPVGRGGVLELRGAGDYVAKETDDPEIIAKIDAARTKTEDAMRAFYEARREEREILAVLAPRCKQARLR